jgi:NAD(P)-dependent dehydrogenase (short-subunit alcohol dehydrogenase family)
MTSKIVIVAGGTTGMGRATALARAARGDDVTVIGRSDRGLTVPFLRADLSSIAEVERVAKEIAARHTRVDALTLFANRPVPRRTETVDGLEYTFALYYLSRYLLAARLAPLMTEESVIVNVSGVGAKAGGIHWDDPQLRTGYGLVKAQLQAGRANDLLGVAHRGAARYVLYHPVHEERPRRASEPVRARGAENPRGGGGPSGGEVGGAHRRVDRPSADGPADGQRPGQTR